MIRVAIMYTLFAAGLAFALGSLHSCVDRMRVKAVTPDERVIPAREWDVDVLPYPSEYEPRTEQGELHYFTTHDSEPVDL